MNTQVVYVGSSPISRMSVTRNAEGCMLLYARGPGNSLYSF